MPTAIKRFLELLRRIGSGDAVTLIPIQQILTTQQAADLLTMSRPHLIKLTEKSDIPHRKLGRHRRREAGDVFAVDCR
jgi:excisionase family DNA binding protein